MNSFEDKYNLNRSDWDGHSGGGSSAYHTIEYRSFLERFIYMNSVRSIVDVGCGDWQFSKFLNFDHLDYTGYDVVSSVIKQNAERHAKTNVIFKHMPNDWTELVNADLLIVKDVLQHLDRPSILRMQKIFIKYKYCLITNSFSKLNTPQNVDVANGDFRCLDLSADPFNFSGAYVLEFGSLLWERLRVFLAT